MFRSLFSRSVVAWAFYDFANSAFATTILSVIFNVYFVKVICGGGVPFGGQTLSGEAFWGLTLSASMLLVFALSPFLGALADHTRSKKKFLFFFCSLGCLATAALFPSTEGDFWRAAFFFLLANVGFSAGNAFYNALLKDVSSTETVGKISGFGWALGYVGGGLLLAVNLAMVQKPEWFGIADQNHMAVRLAIFSVAIWWAVFAVPIFVWVREKERPGEKSSNYIALAWREVFQTLREIRKHKEVTKYLCSYLIYNDGIETVIVMASIFGAKELGFSQGDLILCFLMIQAVAFLGALAFGWAADHVGHKPSIATTLIIYIGVCLWGSLIRTRGEFWILGAVVGLILGGSQAASRSFLSIMVPEEKSAQFFGFFALTGKLSMAVGPAVFGLVSQIYSLRAAVASLSIFFALGLVILYFIRTPELKPQRI